MNINDGKTLSDFIPNYPKTGDKTSAISHQSKFDENTKLAKDNANDKVIKARANLIKSTFKQLVSEYENLEIQSTSNDNYLKSYDLNSPIIDSQNTLNSKIYFEGYNDDLDFNISTEIYEDLSQKKDSDKYELILPNFELTKNLETKFDGSLEMNNLGMHDGDIYKIENIIHEFAISNKFRHEHKILQKNSIILYNKNETQE